MVVDREGEDLTRDLSQPSAGRELPTVLRAQKKTPGPMRVPRNREKQLPRSGATLKGYAPFHSRAKPSRSGLWNFG